MEKIRIYTIVISIVLSFIFISQSFAQNGMNWRRSGGWAMESNYNKLYNLKTVETISGEVVSIDIITPMKGMSNGVHLLLKTDKETISVHLGPSWYIENQDISIKPKDEVEVKGSLITFDGKPAIIAAELKKGNEVLQLRDDNGYPVWSGWRRK
jgi:hypothetical protein